MLKQVIKDKALFVSFVIGFNFMTDYSFLQASEPIQGEAADIKPSLPKTKWQDLRSDPTIQDIKYQQGEFPAEYDALAKIGLTPYYEGKRIEEPFSIKYGITPIPATIAESGRAKIVEGSEASVQQRNLLGGIERRRRINYTNTKEWPYRVHGHVIMKFPNGDKCTGSGILVGPNHVLTAGHNLYDRDSQKWAKEVLFAPGRDEAHYPYGDSKGCILLVHEEWFDKKSKRKDDYDFGMIILDNSLGTKIGWSGLLSLHGVLLENAPISVTGYPGDQGVGIYHSTQMWTMADPIKSVKPEKIFYEIETCEGQSGSGVWGKEWPELEGIYTVGIHTGRETEDAQENRGIRLSQEKFEIILEWLKTYQLGLLPPDLMKPKPTPELADPHAFLDELSQTFESQVSRAKKGEAEALYHLGSFYYKGEEIKKDDKKAFSCFHLAAQSQENYGPALAALGVCYEQGEGIEKNLLKAVSFYYQASPKNVAEATRRLSNLYANEKTLPKRPDSSVVLLREAAKQGDKKACYQLAYLYKEGIKVTQSYLLYEQYLALTNGYVPSPLSGRRDKCFWKPITDKVIYSLPGRPQFVRSFPEFSQESYLTQLWQKLYTVDDASFSQVAVTGTTGGVGKTTLALAYARKALKHNAYDFIYWLNSESDEELLKGYQGILRILEKYPSQGIDNLEFLKEAVQKELNNKKKWLLVYDNVSEPSFLKDKTPQLNGHILITSRCNEGWDHLPVCLDVFREEDALKYFFKEFRYERTEENEQLARQIAKNLGYLPLALSHAKAFIAFNKTTSMQGYLNKLKEQPETIISSVSPFKKKDPGQISYKYFITKTWNIAGEIVSDTAKQLMIYFAYLDPNHLFVDIFSSVYKPQDKIEEAFNELCCYSLIKQVKQEGIFFSIHRLVQLVIRAEQESQEKGDLSALPSSMNIISSCFGTYCQALNQKVIQEDLEASSLDKLHEITSALQGNLTTFSMHLQRVSQAREMNQDHFINLKIYALSLHQLLNYPLAILREQLFKKLDQEKPSEKGHRDPPTHCDFIESIQPLLTADMEEDARHSIIEALSQVGLSQLQQIVESIQFLMAVNVKQDILAGVIEFLIQVDSSQYRKFAESIHPLLTADIEENIRNVAITLIISQVSPSQWHKVVQSIRPLLTPTTDEGTLAGVIMLLSQVDPSQYCEAVEGIQPLLTANMDGFTRFMVIKALSYVNPSQYRKLTENLRPLLTADMEEDTLVEVIKIMRQVNHFQRRELTEILQPFLTPDMEENIKAWVIGIMWHMDLSQRREFERIEESLLSLDMDGFSRLMVIEALSQVDPSQYGDLVQNLHLLLTSDMDGETRAMVIDAQNHVDHSHYHEFAQSFQSLVTPVKDEHDRKELIKLLIQVDPSERHEFAGILKSLVVMGKIVLEECKCELDEVGDLSHMDPSLSFAFISINMVQLDLIIDTLSSVGSQKLKRICEKLCLLLELSRKDEQNLQDWDKEFKVTITTILQREGPVGLIKLLKMAYN